MFYSQNYLYAMQRNYQQSRFIGGIWPFVGGLLIGGLVGANYPHGATSYPPAYLYQPAPYGPIYYPTNSNVPNPSYYINPYQPTNMYVDSATSITETPIYSYKPYN